MPRTEPEFGVPTYNSIQQQLQTIMKQLRSVYGAQYFFHTVYFFYPDMFMNGEATKPMIQFWHPCHFTPSS